jgi:PEGA domain-containing protein
LLLPSALPTFWKFCTRFYPDSAVSTAPSASATEEAASPEESPDSEPSRISSSAPDRVGTVIVTSEPDGAEIFVDGKFYGNTSATLRLPAGSHAILLKFPGRADWRRTLEVLKSSKASLKATLDPAS